MALPPEIHTYHCLCNSLLLASTHILSSLPRRKPNTSGGDREDAALILPLPSAPPDLSPSPGDDDANATIDPSSEDEDQNQRESNARTNSTLAAAAAAVPTIPPQGYTVLLSLLPDRNKTTIVRREDGFEKRTLYRCARCRLVVGYEILNPSSSVSASVGGEAMDLDDDGESKRRGKGKGEREIGEAGAYVGKVLYLLPGGIMSTEFMAGESGGGLSEGGVGVKKKKKKIGEGMVELNGTAVGVFE